MLFELAYKRAERLVTAEEVLTTYPELRPYHISAERTRDEDGDFYLRVFAELQDLEELQLFRLLSRRGISIDFPIDPSFPPRIDFCDYLP